jgi:hypothetical protein
MKIRSVSVIHGPLAISQIKTILTSKLLDWILCRHSFIVAQAEPTTICLTENSTDRPWPDTVPASSSENRESDHEPSRCHTRTFSDSRLLAFR